MVVWKIVKYRQKPCQLQGTKHKKAWATCKSYHRPWNLCPRMNDKNPKLPKQQKRRRRSEVSSVAPNIKSNTILQLQVVSAASTLECQRVFSWWKHTGASGQYPNIQHLKKKRKKNNQVFSVFIWMGEKMTLHFNDTIYRPDWVDLLSKTKEIVTEEMKKCASRKMAGVQNSAKILAKGCFYKDPKLRSLARK